MCAMDRSQIMVYSQSEIINHLEDLLSISSSQSFVRDAQGELIYLSPPFERTVLNGNELNIWFSSIPVNVRLDLFNAELNSLSGMGPFVFKNVKSSAFLLGKEKDWACNFDWIFNPSNFVKILEGNYNKNNDVKSNCYD